MWGSEAEAEAMDRGTGTQAEAITVGRVPLAPPSRWDECLGWFDGESAPRITGRWIVIRRGRRGQCRPPYRESDKGIISADRARVRVGESI